MDNKRDRMRKHRELLQVSPGCGAFVRRLAQGRVARKVMIAIRAAPIIVQASLQSSVGGLGDWNCRFAGRLSSNPSAGLRGAVAPHSQSRCGPVGLGDGPARRIGWNHQVIEGPHAFQSKAGPTGVPPLARITRSAFTCARTYRPRQ